MGDMLAATITLLLVAGCALALVRGGQLLVSASDLPSEPREAHKSGVLLGASIALGCVTLISVALRHL